MAGLNVRTIQRIERGRSASLETRKSLAAALEIDIDALDLTLEGAAQAVLGAQKVEIHMLLAVGVVFVLFGASAVAQAGVALAAVFYGAAAFCFAVAAGKMLRHNVYC